MPLTKTRGILREYLQVLILKEVYKSQEGRHLYFTGGTYLRLVHNLKRFSEDLDFNTDILTKSSFEKMVKKVQVGLKYHNIEASVRFDHWDNILSGQLAFPSIEKAYNISSPFSKKEGIIIKLEANRPKWKIKRENEVIAGFAEMYLCVCTDKSALFADKIDAFNKKMRGRHLYDLIFMLSNKYPIDKNVLKYLKIEGDPLEAVKKRLKDLTASDLRGQAETLRLFLFDESEADLLVQAKAVIPSLIAKYRAATL
ncbi:MAG: nucleotidyl transferase AbiEii/AbiGii toxin family protein [Candidatus Omnitrophota bacterium]